MKIQLVLPGPSFLHWLDCRV